jgi:hypothetical protein
VAQSLSLVLAILKGRREHLRFLLQRYTSCHVSYTISSLPPQAERALQLWKDGYISIASQKASLSGSGIIKVINKESGKPSGRSTDFAQANWANATAEYLASLDANFRNDAKFDNLVNAAKAFVASNRRGDSKSPLILLDDDDAEAPGERALLVEDLDSDDLA